MAGNAVGLGNFLRFPIKAVENGGGSFIIPYLVCFLLMGIPLLWIEWTMGRFGGRFGNHSTPFILDNMTQKRFWKYFGVFGIFTNIGVAAYYCYIESWTLTYVIESVTGGFAGRSVAEVESYFTEYVGMGFGLEGLISLPMLVYIVCIAINTYFLSKGLRGGVEKVATWAMPVLIFFGLLLAIRGLTLGETGVEGCKDCNAFLALDYLWKPTITSIADPKVWLEAAGQIFFTLSVGMGTIHCYSSYVRSKDDVALNAMSAGWMNGFVEIVLGAAVVIPIATGYLGIDWVKENAGFSMAFQTMPYLFDQWGSVFGSIAGLFWFGLLFIAGITSSLAMGTPWLGFMADEFNWNRKKAAISFGAVLLLIGIPTVIFFHRGVFDEYDFWTGTFSLVIFALAETILFAWIFGIKRGWKELNKGADLKPPVIFRYIMTYVTPVMLIILFFSAMFKPANNEWEKALAGDWELSSSSVVGKIMNKGVKANREYASDIYEADNNGFITSVSDEEYKVVISDTLQFYVNENDNIIRIDKLGEIDTSLYTVFDSVAPVQEYTFIEGSEITVKLGDQVRTGDQLAKGFHYNDILYTDLARVYLALLFAGICVLVYIATVRRRKSGRVDVDSEPDED